MSDDLFAALDTETNKLPNYKLPADHPDQPRLAAVGLILLKPDLTFETEIEHFIKPDGWEMLPDATAVNGLTTEFLMANGIPIRDVLETYSGIIKSGRCIVAHNAQHDCKVMRGELRRAGMDDLFEQTRNVCTMRKAMGHVIKADGKKGWPKLSDLCAHFSIPQPEKHTALSDARSAALGFAALRGIGVDLTPEVHYAKNKDANPTGEKLKTALKESAKQDDNEIPT